MNFANITGITIPEGEAVKITSGGVTLWEKASTPTADYYGTSTASNSNDLILLAYADLGNTLKYSNLVVIKKTTTEETNVVTRIENGILYFVDGGTSENFEVALHGVNTGTGLRIYNCRTPDDDEALFDGEYEWRFDFLMEE